MMNGSTPAGNRGRLAGARRLLGILAILALAGCRGDASTSPTPTPPPPPTPRTPVDQRALMSDFTLTDVNPNSPTSGQPVSPRRFQGKISAWYFGHST